MAKTVKIKTSGKTSRTAQETAPRISLSGRLLAAYIRLVARTSTIICDSEDIHALVRAPHPAVMACWHGQFLMAAIFRPSDMPVTAMVARHRDAELVGQVMTAFGVGLVRGAGAGHRRRDRGGMTALRQGLRALKDGATLFMTADVPPGPARQAGLGVITIARMSGRPILPVATATSRYKAFSSWSRFTLNLPFSRLGVAIGEPVFVPRDAGEAAMEEARRLVEQRLDTVTARAYELAGARDPFAVFYDKRNRRSLVLAATAALGRTLGPVLVPALVNHRCRRGKEDPKRTGERYGRPSFARPQGPLVWFHAASVGETNTILPLLRRLEHDRPDLHILLTTGTLTSARLAAQHLPKGAIHQFIPFDVPQYVSRFLDHWRPDLALFVESEIWPNLIRQTADRQCPLVVLNGRLSKRSFRRWRLFEGAALPLFGRFDLVLAQNAASALHFSRLGARHALDVGNLKHDAPPPAYDAQALDGLRRKTRDRRILLAASTHAGEEEAMAAVHTRLAQSIPGLLTIIVPRHPERGPDIAARLESGFNLKTSLRSTNAMPEPEIEIYIADTLGELGLFYRLAHAGFVGGSLVRHGGQNPIEPIKCGMPVLSGPHTFNFRDLYDRLQRRGGAALAQDTEELTGICHRLLTDPGAARQQAEKASAIIAELGGALERTLEALDPLWPNADPQQHAGQQQEEQASAAHAAEDMPRAS